jgi:hypothetical protein
VIGCSALIVAGCGSGGATGPESSPKQAAFALAQIMEAKALATNPSPPEGKKVATTCSRVKNDEWTCSVVYVGPEQLVTAESGYADNIVVYDGHGTFELKPARAALSDNELSGAIPLAAFRKMEEADGTSMGDVSFPNVAAESEPQDLEAVASSLSPGSVAGGSSTAGTSTTATGESSSSEPQTTSTPASQPSTAEQTRTTSTAPAAAPCQVASAAVTAEIETAAKNRWKEVSGLTNVKVCGEWASATWPAAQPQAVVFRRIAGRWQAVTYGTALDTPGHEEYPRTVIEGQP